MNPNPLSRTFDESKRGSYDIISDLLNKYYISNIFLSVLIAIICLFPLIYEGNTIFISEIIHLVIRIVIIGIIVSSNLELKSLKLLHVLAIMADVFFLAFLFKDEYACAITIACALLDIVLLIYYIFSETMRYNEYASSYHIINPMLKNAYSPTFSAVKDCIIENNLCISFETLLYHMIETKVIQWSSKAEYKNRPNIMRSIVLFYACFFVAILALDKKYIISDFYNDDNRHKPDAAKYKKYLDAMRSNLIMANGWSDDLIRVDSSILAEFTFYMKVCLDNSDTNIQAIESFAYDEMFRIVEIEPSKIAIELINFYKELIDPRSFDNYYYEYIDTQPTVYSGLPLTVQEHHKHNIKPTTIKPEHTLKSSSQQSNRSKPQPERLFCTKCGVHLPADAVFCHKCGNKVYKG